MTRQEFNLEPLQLSISGISVNKNVIRFIVKPLFVLFIYFGFFSRITGVFGFSGGLISALVTLVLFLMCFAHVVFNRFIKVSPLVVLTGVFFIFGAITPLLSSFFLEVNPSFSMRFSIEMMVAFCMFFNIYYLVKTGVITPRFFLYTLIFLAIISALQLFVILFSSPSFYRLYGLSGTNYIANAFSLSTCALMLVMMKCYLDDQRLKAFGLLFLVLLFLVTTFLIGSRQAVIAVVMGIVGINLLTINSKKILILNLAGFGIVLLILFLLSFTIDLSFLLRRFTMENISEAASMRFELYSRSVLDLTLADVMFGRPDLYLEVNPDGGEGTVVPHNILLSIIRYNGIFILFIFIFAIGAIFFEYLKLRIRNNNNRRFIITESSIAILLLIVLIYTMLSGQLTKVFSLFVILGYATGYIELTKEYVSEESYRKIIL